MVTAERLQGELAVVMRSGVAGGDEEPDSETVRRGGEDLGPGSYEQNAEDADDIPLGTDSEAAQDD